MKKNVLEIMEKLEALSNDNYSLFELALVLFLRADTEEVKKLSEKDLEDINDEIKFSESLVQEDIRDFVDNKVWGE